MGSLGDVCRGLCLVDHIKNHWPDSTITWLVESRWADLVEIHPNLDRTIIFQRAWRIAAIWDLYKQLKQHHFDITLDLQRILKSGLLSRMSGARRRIGFHRRNAKELNWLFNNEHIDYFSDELPKLQHYLKFTEYLNLPEPTALNFGFSMLDIQTSGPADMRNVRKPYIAVVMGSSWDSKDWFPEAYSRLTSELVKEHHLGIVLLGDHSQIEAAGQVLKHTKLPDVINMVGKTTLLELASILKGAAIGVGPDSGPGHLAAAVGTPFVALFGPTDPIRTAPYGSEDLVVRSEIHCSPCYKKQCPENHKQCIHDIEVATVIDTIIHTLEDHGIVSMNA
jgi:lipopolysaccharide heptosyltransferase II